MKKIAIIGLFLSFALGSFAQVRYNSGGGSSKPKSQGFDKSKLVIGGGVGGGYSQGSFMIGLSPMVGYKVTPNFIAGVSLSFQYQNLKNYFPQVMNTTTGRYEDNPLKSTLVAPGAWLRYNLGGFFVQAHFEQQFSFNRWKEAAALAGGSGIEKVKFNYNMPTLLLGGGYRLQLGGRATAYFGAYYDVLQKVSEKTFTASNGDQYIIRSPYYGVLQPVIGFGFGF